MNEILANFSLGLLMILFQEENPIFLVSVLRLCIGLAACAGVAWVIGYVIKDLRQWF